MSQIQSRIHTLVGLHFPVLPPTGVLASVQVRGQPKVCICKEGEAPGSWPGTLSGLLEGGTASGAGGRVHGVCS